MNYTKFSDNEFDSENDKLEQIMGENLESRREKMIKGVCADKSYISGSDIIINGDKNQKVRYKDAMYIYSNRIARLHQVIIDNIEKIEENTNFSFKTDDLYIDDSVNSLISNDEYASFYSVYATFLLTCEKVREKLKSNNPMYNELMQDIKKYKTDIHEKLKDENKFQSVENVLCYACRNSSTVYNSMLDKNTTFSAENAIYITRSELSQKSYKDLAADVILLAPTEFIKKLEKSNFFLKDFSVNYYASLLKDCEKDLNYESKYMTTKSKIIAYMYGFIDGEHLKKKFDINSMFDEKYLIQNTDLSGFDGFFVEVDGKKLTYKDHAEQMMQILDEVKPEYSCSEGFWNYYMNGILNKEQIKECLKKGYANLDVICEEYLSFLKNGEPENQGKKPIEYENIYDFDFIFNNPERIYQFFDPEMILYAMDDKTELRAQPIHEIFQLKLKNMYKQHNVNYHEEFIENFINNLDLFKEITKEEMKENKQDLNNFDDEYQKRMAEHLIALYQNGYIGAKQLKNERLPKDIIEKIEKLKIQDNQQIIELYNNDIISQETILNRFDTDVLFDMVLSQGLNPSVLEDYYSVDESTVEIINNVLKRKQIIDEIKSDEELDEEMLSGHWELGDLSRFRYLINIDQVRKMYQSSRNVGGNDNTNGLDYDDLNYLVSCGLLTEDEADKIDQEYDYKLKIDQLIEQGLIVGDKNGIKVDRNSDDNENSKYLSQYGFGKIDERDKQSLYLALDDEFIELELNSEVLKKYNLVIMPKDKIAIMEPSEEGTGASYVMSIKLALDQISESENAEGEERIDPLKAYQNRTGIRSIPGMEIVNHRETWGFNLEKKMGMIHKNMNELIYLKDSDESKKAEHKLKIEKLQHKIKRNYLDARENIKDNRNKEVE